MFIKNSPFPSSNIRSFMDNNYIIKVINLSLLIILSEIVRCLFSLMAWVPE